MLLGFRWDGAMFGRGDVEFFSFSTMVKLINIPAVPPVINV